MSKDEENRMIGLFSTDTTLFTEYAYDGDGLKKVAITSGACVVASASASSWANRDSIICRGAFLR